MNPCPCGYFSDHPRMPLHRRDHPALPEQGEWPLLDRIDLHIEVPAVTYKELCAKDTGASSADMRVRVEASRAIQQQRGFYNARIPSRQLRKLCALDDAGEVPPRLCTRRYPYERPARSGCWP